VTVLPAVASPHTYDPAGNVPSDLKYRLAHWPSESEPQHCSTFLIIFSLEEDGSGDARITRRLFLRKHYQDDGSPWKPLPLQRHLPTLVQPVRSATLGDYCEDHSDSKLIVKKLESATLDFSVEPLLCGSRLRVGTVVVR